VIQQASKALADGHAAHAQHLLHTLRGTAGTVGAMHLAELAGKLERECALDNHNHQDLTPLLNQAESVLQRLVSDINQAFTPEITHVNASAIDWPVIQNIVAQLESLLLDHNAEAVDLFGTYSEGLRQALGPHFAAVATPIDDYDFSDALTALINARAHIPELFIEKPHG
jgi:two-component system, sensor histidine kinase and response regulator